VGIVDNTTTWNTWHTDSTQLSHTSHTAPPTLITRPTAVEFLDEEAFDEEESVNQQGIKGGATGGVGGEQ
jgi:hypothetical protein